MLVEEARCLAEGGRETEESREKLLVIFGGKMLMN